MMFPDHEEWSDYRSSLGTDASMFDEGAHLDCPWDSFDSLSVSHAIGDIVRSNGWWHAGTAGMWWFSIHGW